VTVQHSELSGSQVHEPLGVSAASVDTYYLSDGAAAGAWSTVFGSSVDSSISADASVELTSLGDYSTLFIELEGIGYNVNGVLQLLVGSSGGYLTTGGYSGFKKSGATESWHLDEDYLVISSDRAGAGETYYQSSWINISNFNSANFSAFTWNGISSSDAGHTATSDIGWGIHRTNESVAYDRIKILPGTGTLTGTALRVYGLKG
jgi:hypothetical protein